MKDADYRKHKKRVEALLRKWEQPLGIRWWKIKHEYFDGPLPLRAAIDAAPPVGRTVLMDCLADWKYLEALIRIDVSGVADQTDDDLENAVVHELCHVLVNEMREDGMEHEERVVSGLARAFIWVREAGGGRVGVAPADLEPSLRVGCT